MAKSKVPPPNPPTVTPEKGLIRLKKQLEKGEALLTAQTIPDDEFKNWRHAVKQLIQDVFF